MEIILGKMASGKTTELLKKASKDGCVIVCSDRYAVKNLLFLANRMNLVIETPITIVDLINSRRGLNSPVLIDDTERCLDFLIGCRSEIKAITIDTEHNKAFVLENYKKKILLAECGMVELQSKQNLSLKTEPELSELFHKVIKEMNRRKAIEQNVDVGFWDSDGNYKEDIQTITPEEYGEIQRKQANERNSEVFND